MNYSFAMLLGAALIIVGVANMFGYAINRAIKQDYTEKSVKRWRPYGGTVNCIYGLALLVLGQYFMYGKTWLVIAAVAIAAGGIYLAYWAMKKFLVKMDK